MLRLLRSWADLLDSRFVIPGTKIRFGLDPILSLVPGLGDLASPVFAMLLVGQGVQQRVPRIVLVRMMLNALIDALIGAIPVIGNIGDVFFRANLMNLALLERHARPGLPPSRGDYAFVMVVALIFGVIIAIPVIVAVWLTLLIFRFFAG
jgi:Domain of unknown function (DUF4112)